jgi:hypothetical protein
MGAKRGIPDVLVRHESDFPSARKSAETLNFSRLSAALNFAYNAVDEKPEVLFMFLKRLVGERGFEPPTPWSRTRFKRLLKSIESRRFQVIAVESVAGRSLKAIEL